MLDVLATARSWFSSSFAFAARPVAHAAFGRLDGCVPCATIFLPILFTCNRLCAGVNRKLKWLVQGGKYREYDSTLPRLLMAVYTPLLRCATASEACNLACGLRTKQTGAALSSPFRISGLSSAYALEPLFLFSAHRFFISCDNRFLPAGVRRSPFLLLRVARLGTALVLAADLGDWPSSAAMARLSQSLSLFSSATILPVSNMPASGS